MKHSKTVILISVLLVFLSFIFFIFKSKPEGAGEIRLESFQTEFSQDLLHSNLYAPESLKVDSVKDGINISWSFPVKKLITNDSDASEYATLSGFRIYRDGFWYTDVDKDSTNFIDRYVSNRNKYSYEVSALTFDNKIEGEKSVVVNADAKNSDNNNQKQSDMALLSLNTVLVEGDSIARGQRANPKEGYADQVKSWVLEKGGNLFNLAVDGSYSFDVENRIASESAKYNPGVVILGFGVNDLYAKSNYLGNWSILGFIENYQSVINKIDNGKTVVIVSITPAKDEEEKRVAWNKALKDLAVKNDVIYIDTSDLGDEYLVDKIHPNQELHNIVAERIIKVLGSRLK